MKREYMIERQGRAFVLYAGLLNEAHENGLKAIRTRLLQAPSAENGETTICFAEVELQDGRVFTGIGDATPQNVGRNIVPHAIRMAETRAKARALRDAVNIGAAALEELGDVEDLPIEDEAPRRTAAPPTPLPQRAVEHRVPPQRPTPIGQRAERVPAATAAAPRPVAPRPAQPAGGDDSATQAQVRAIYLIGRDQHGLSDADVDERSIGMFGSRPGELTKKQASTLISTLKGEGQPAAS